MKWQPIDTAPKDGSMVMLYRPDAIEWAKVCIGKYDDNRYHKKPNPYWALCLHIGGRNQARQWSPTHWMPLPDAPEIDQ